MDFKTADRSSKCIIALREKLMLTQVEFAKRVGYSYSTIQKWEQGIIIPRFKAQRKLLEIKSEGKQ